MFHYISIEQYLHAWKYYFKPCVRLYMNFACSNPLGHFSTDQIYLKCDAIGCHVRKYCKEKQPVGTNFWKPTYEWPVRVSSHFFSWCNSPVISEIWIQLKMAKKKGKAMKIASYRLVTNLQ